jgi:hypothetical protein
MKRNEKVTHFLTSGGSRFGFWANEKQNKFNKTAVLISNLCVCHGFYYD